MPLIGAFTISRLVHLAAELGLADILADEPKAAAAIAAKTGSHPQSLHRVMRALAAFGVFDERESGKFALTAMGTQLRSDVPSSLRNFARFYGDQRSWRCYGDIEHCVRTGDTAMRHLYGMGAFEYLADRPDEAAIFNAAMADNTRRIALAATAAYDFSAFPVLMDVGGGNGTLIAELLRAAPASQGLLFDLPAGVTDAEAVLANAGVRERCKVVPGDFFKSVPSGADAIVLKSVIHDWDDEGAVSILKCCRAAAGPQTRLLLIERIMPKVMTASPANQRAALLDIRMLVMPGGRERTEDEYKQLMEVAGFHWSRSAMLPEPIDMAIVEGIPA